jgi:hypothetical protein
LRLASLRVLAQGLVLAPRGDFDVDDDDDWVGEPPEGRHTRDQADPGHWNRQWQGGAITGGVILLLIVVVLVIVLLG